MSQRFAIPVGLNPTAIGVSMAWWIEVARRSEAAGFASVWHWDHFISRGKLHDPLLECWTTLTAVAASTERIQVGSFVVNNANRHPAVLANIVATLADLAPGRVELGIGIGGHPDEHAAYGIDFPPPKVRAEQLEESIAVLRLLAGGGPVDYDGRFYQLREARCFPVPDPPVRLTVAGARPAGTRLAARLGDAWTCFGVEYDRLRPVFDETLAAAGREPEDVDVIVAVEPEDVGPSVAELAERWRERGATELIVHDLDPGQVDRMLALV